MQNEEFNLYLYIFVLLSWKQFRHIETIIIIIKWIQYSSWRIFFQSHFLILFAVIHFGTFRIFGIVFFLYVNGTRFFHDGDDNNKCSFFLSQILDCDDDDYDVFFWVLVFFSLVSCGWLDMKQAFFCFVLAGWTM